MSAVQVDTPTLAAGFLEILFDECDGDWIDVRLIEEHKQGGCRQLWFRGVRAFLDRLPSLADTAYREGRAVFFGVLPRGQRGNGTKSGCAPGWAIYADIDYKDVPQEEAEQRLRAFPAPSMVVQSGHGMHLYWLLQERADPPVIEEYSRRVASALGADSCFDCARVLRLPGTRNLKEGWSGGTYTAPAAAPLVRLPVCDPSRRYQPHDFDFLPEAEPSPSTVAHVPRAGSIIEGVPAVVGRLLRKHEWLRALWNGEGRASGDTSNSGYDLALAGALTRCGVIDPDVLDAAVRARPYKGGGNKEGRTDRNVQRCVDRALADAAARRPRETGQGQGQGQEPEGPPPPGDEDAPRRPAPLAPPGSIEEQHAPDVEAARSAVAAILDHLRADPQRKDAAAALLSSARDAIAWLATFYPAEWRAAHADIASCPRAKSLADLHDRAIRELAKSRRDEAIPARKAMAATGISLDGAEADPGLSMPVPYVLDDGGVWRHERDGSISQVCRAPIFVASVGESADGTRTVLLRYRLGGRWLTADVPRTAASVGRELAALGGQGLPVSSASAAGLVAYFEAFLVHNAAVLRVENVRASLGWIEGGASRAFLWGTTVIGSADARPSSALAEQFPVIAGYRASGTLVGWRRAYDLVREMEAFQLALLVACAPPFIRLVPGAPNPIMDFAGATSEGKTTALRFAASAWGLPDDRDAHGILRTWDVTPTWLERAAAATSDLPLVLDDSKRQDKPEVVRGVVYAIAQGQGRGRGTVTGVQHTATWHTALISSGENPLVAHLKGHGGAQARVITSLGSPLGGKSQEHARVARELRATVLEHHGHAGPAVVRWLLDDDNLDQARATYAAALEAWSARAGDDAIAARRAETFALLSTVAATLRDIGIGTEERHLLAAWSRARMDTGADVAVAAMMATWEWTVTRQAAIYGRHDAGRPPARFDGRAERGDPWAVALAPGALREHLAHLGFEPEAVIAQWADRDWLLRGDGNNTTRKARVNGAPVRLYCVTTAALREAGCIAADAEPWTWTETDERKPPSWLDNADM